MNTLGNTVATILVSQHESAQLLVGTSETGADERSLGKVHWVHTLPTLASSKCERER